MVKEFQQVQRIDLPSHEHPEEEVIAKKPKKPGWDKRIWSTIRAYGPMAICFLLVPALLWFGTGDGQLTAVHTWPDSVQSVPVVGESGVNNIKLLRGTAGPTSDGVLQAKATIAQMDTRTAASAHSPNIAQIKVGIRNLSSSSQHLNMHDFSAIDRKSRRLVVDAANTLRFASPVDYRTLQPGQTWTGWLRFFQHDTPIGALVIEPSRHSKLYLTFKEQQPPARSAP